VNRPQPAGVINLSTGGEHALLVAAMQNAGLVRPRDLCGEWVEASSDVNGRDKALRRVIAGYGEEQQPSIGAMDAEIDQPNY